MNDVQVNNIYLVLFEIGKDIKKISESLKEIEDILSK